MKFIFTGHGQNYYGQGGNKPNYPNNGQQPHVPPPVPAPPTQSPAVSPTAPAGGCKLKMN